MSSSTPDWRADRLLGDAPLEGARAGDLRKEAAQAVDYRLGDQPRDRGATGDQAPCPTPCAPGQDCVAGKCTCLAGGACAGCCKDDACIAAASQQTALCGAKGQACVSCLDASECTTDVCVNGGCTHVAVLDGTPCAGGSCKGGVCSGCTPSCSGKQCGPDGCGGSCGSCSTPPNTTCNGSGQCVCTPSCGGKNCGADGCGGSCGSCGGGDYCASGSCTPCPTCSSLGYYTGALRGCTFDGSNDCWCPGSDSNSNNGCDPGEACWGSDNCSTGNHKPANCTTKKNISVPSGCTPPGYCFECS